MLRRIVKKKFWLKIIRTAPDACLELRDGGKMKIFSKILLFILIILYCFLFMQYKPWEPLIDRSRTVDTILASLVIIILTGLTVCALAMLFGKKGLKKWFIFFNFPYLIFGLYITQFAWTFWLFKTPTLLDKIKSSAIPFLLGVILPIAVVIYFIKWEKK